MKTIFISVASYRDFYCSKTLESIYSNAEYPDRVIVGLCIQNEDADEKCVLAQDTYKNNIRTINIKAHEAKGPTWARYLCVTLMQGEDYFLQIDSHTLFEKNWDSTLVAMIEDIKQNTESKKVVISHYPPNYDDIKNETNDVHMVETLCGSFFNEDGVVSFLGAEKVDMKKYKYVQTPHIAAGMFFCEGSCVKEVPYDPYLPDLFVGEEILHSARIWTSGYDIYTPTQIVVYHLYTRDDQPHVWDDKKTYNNKHALNKVKMLMTMEPESGVVIPEHVLDSIDKYGLGTDRTLQQYFDYAGIDLKNKKVTKQFCPHKTDGPPPSPPEQSSINLNGLGINGLGINESGIDLYGLGIDLYGIKLSYLSAAFLFLLCMVIYFVVVFLWIRRSKY